MPETARQRRASAGPRSAEDPDESAVALIHRVGGRVRAARKKIGFTRRELAERSGVSPRYLAQLEGGEGNISIGLLERVAIALEQPIEALVGKADPDPLAAEIATVATLYSNADAGTRARVLQELDPERRRAQKAERICLIGLRGAGKSTLGALAARDLGLPFVELNDEIENDAGLSVGEIIALYGQEGYRQLESDALNSIVASRHRLVLAVAGGIVADPETFARVLARFHTVWIKASPTEHMERVRAQGDMRPMVGNPQAMAQLRQILKTREAQYRQAEYQLDTSGRTVDDSRAELRELIRSHRVLEAHACRRTVSGRAGAESP